MYALFTMYVELITAGLIYETDLCRAKARARKQRVWSRAACKAAQAEKDKVDGSRSPSMCTWPSCAGSRFTGSPGRLPPVLPRAKPLEYTSRHRPGSRLMFVLPSPPAQVQNHLNDSRRTRSPLLQYKPDMFQPMPTQPVPNTDTESDLER